MEPITREEYFLAKINGDDVQTPNPITRVERYYDIIAGNDGDILPPVTREEFYLAKIAGLDIDIPEPVTRIEKYLAAIAGADIQVPIPITRKELYLAAWAEYKPQTYTGKIVSFITNKSRKLLSLIATLTPSQDLHGYDAPWPAGGGKNLFNPTDLEEKTDWSGLTLTKNADGSFVVNGTATSTVYQNIYIDLKAGSYVLSGCPSGGSTGSYSIYTPQGSVYDTGDGANITLSEDTSVRIIIPRIVNGTQCNNLLFKPMICKADATDPTTFAPYSNLCPISGNTGVTVEHTGKNLANVTTATITRGTIMTFTKPLPTGDYMISMLATRTGESTAQASLRFFFEDGTYQNLSFDVNTGERVGNGTKLSFSKKLSSIYAYSISNAYSASGDYTLTLTDILLERGDTATDFEPYSGTSYPITFPALGKNLASGSISGGSIGATGVIGSKATYDMAYGKVEHGKKYTITTDETQFVGGFFEELPEMNSQSYNETRTIGGKTFTAPIDGYVAFRIGHGYSTYQLEVGETATTYEPYTNTLYGGTLTVNEDGSGQVVANMAAVDMGSLPWSKSNSGAGRFYSPSTTGNLPYKYAEDAIMLCSSYRFDGYGTGTIGYYGENGTFRYFLSFAPNPSAAREIYVVDEAKDSMTAADFKTAVTGQTLCYELAEPVTIPLTAQKIQTLVGTNNVWVDESDEIEVTV